MGLLRKLKEDVMPKEKKRPPIDMEEEDEEEEDESIMSAFAKWIGQRVKKGKRKLAEVE